MIELTGVAKRFAGNGAPALDDVSLTIAKGEIFGVIGRSGAGKSTLIRLINGLERPTAGRVTVDGADVATLAAPDLRRLRRRVGMIFQNFGLLSSRTAADNIAYPLELAGVARAERATRVAALLDRVGLSARAGAYPAQLSGGEKQRVAIARAIATDPAILLCDEATSALDPETTHSILALLARLNRELGLTIVLITHEMSVIRAICHRVAVLDRGRIVEVGTVEAVFGDARHATTKALLEAYAA